MMRLLSSVQNLRRSRMSFQNKVALVTGAGSGLGEAVARELAGLGASVVLADINSQGAQRVANDIVATGGKAVAIAADSASAADNEKVVAFAVKTFGDRKSTRLNSSHVRI